MDDQEALELVDAHLDGEVVTPDQAKELANWLRDNPQHADQAFHRIFLHTFLLQRLQHELLPAASALSLSKLADDSTAEPMVLQSGPIPTDDQPNSRGKQRTPHWRRIWTLCIALCLLGTAAGLTFRELFSPGGRVVGLWAYEGFDYPPTTPPPPLGDGSKWPSSGGIQGSAGGFGWKEPWRESASKVGILVADMQANAWRPSDMRKFGPLGYADSAGNVLRSTGIQFRSAAGPLSTTVRSLDMTSFPAGMTDERGIGRDGSIVWLSFLAQSFDGRGLGNFAYVQLGTDSAGFRLGKLASVPSGNWSASGVLDGAELNLRWSDVPSGQAVFLVTRITFRPGSEGADVWINPKLNAEPSTNTATLRLTLPDFHFDQLSISSRYTTDFDEIRIGGSFRDVTPTR